MLALASHSQSLNGGNNHSPDDVLINTRPIRPERRREQQFLDGHSDNLKPQQQLPHPLNEMGAISPLD